MNSELNIQGASMAPRTPASEEVLANSGTADKPAPGKRETASEEIEELQAEVERLTGLLHAEPAAYIVSHESCRRQLVWADEIPLHSGISYIPLIARPALAASNDLDMRNDERAPFEDWWYAKINSGFMPLDIAFGMHVEGVRVCRERDAALATRASEAAPVAVGDARKALSLCVHALVQSQQFNGPVTRSNVQEAIDAGRAALASQAAPVTQDALQASEQRAAMATLTHLGYTWNGGEMWKPPLGEKPKWVDEPVCVCGNPRSLGVVHRADGPCYIPEPASTASKETVTLKDEEIAELRSALDASYKITTLLTHKIITCGVAARHPDANLSRTGSYGGKWNSPQAEDVRALRDAHDALLAQRDVSKAEGQS